MTHHRKAIVYVIDKKTGEIVHTEEMVRDLMKVTAYRKEWEDKGYKTSLVKPDDES